jgi:hypothetical protein
VHTLFLRNVFEKKIPNDRNWLNHWADDMITIFSDFPQVSAKQFAFFLKTNVMIHFLTKLAVFLVNRQFFAHFWA